MGIQTKDEAALGRTYFMPRLITLTTDFGTDSPYVAQMKAVLYSMAPQVTLIDITHAIEPQAIRQGAIILHDTCRWFPAGTIHVAVVDPGVGTQRKIIAARLDQHFFVGPDNGLVSLWAERVRPSELVELNRPQYWRQAVSWTFHGRDIMAPVAAHLANGTPLHSLGTPRTDWCRLAWNQPRWEELRVVGEVILVDRFGNLLTNILQEEVVHRRIAIDTGWFGDRPIRVVETYGQAPPGTLVGLFGSQGRFEVAVVQGNAATLCSQPLGTPVTLEFSRSGCSL